MHPFCFNYSNVIAVLRTSLIINFETNAEKVTAFHLFSSNLGHQNKVYKILVVMCICVQRTEVNVMKQIVMKKSGDWVHLCTLIL